MAERRDPPLLRSGDARRIARGRRASLRRRTLIAGAGILLLGATTAFSSPILFVWNISASAPLGLYLVDRSKVPGRGDMVVARMPAAMAQLAAERRYLPRNVFLVKRIEAASGDRVCGAGDALLINGARVARRLRADRRGRAMPWWEGCRRLGRDGVLLLMKDRPDSFDGRYFAVTDRAEIVGKAVPIWAR
jgi:conjugative transfer signal peptidase TraF